MAEYVNRAQYGSQAFTWDPAAYVFSGDIQENSPGYLTEMLGRLDRQGQLQPWEADELAQWQAQARAIPTRDIASLTAQWQGENRGGDFDEQGMWRPYDQQWWSRLDPGSPDAGPIMLQIRDKIDAGQASAQEKALYDQTLGMAQDWNYRASVPQASDAFSIFGDNLLGALAVLGMGATGGLAGGALAAGGGLASTLGSLGTLSGIAGTGANVIGGATGQDWLSKMGLGLGIAGGLTGGLAGLSNLWSSGVNSLSDAARLASSTGKVVGSLGRIPGADPLKQAGSYLGLAGQAGSLGSSAADWLDWGGTNSPLAANVAPGVQNLLSAADVATQRGGGSMADDWTDWGGGDFPGDYSTDVGAGTWGSSSTPDSWGTGDYPGDASGGLYGGLSLEDQVKQALAGRPDLYGSASAPQAGSLWGTLGSLGSGALKMLLGSAGGGTGGGALGPLLASLGSVGGGAIGSNAANEAARLQAAALNRGIDLSQAQWLQQQARTQPWISAGQQALGTLQGLAGQPLPGIPGAPAAISGGNYPLPGTTPGWQPEAYRGPAAVQAGDYRWTPQQGPQAADYRYTPGAIPQASQYRYTPGAVPTLSGQELFANDPGVQFRLDEGRKALEASALARGTGMSGATLAALQRQGQELSSQEYGNAWQRAAQQAQMREGWAQQASQMGWGQAEAESRLREQVNQIASQQGWTQAQAEAAFREQQAQLASQQGWTQALQGQQNAFTQGLDTSKWNTLQQQQYAQEQYKNMLEQSRWRYGQDVSQNETDYTRQQALYKQQLAQALLPWEQNSTLAQLGAQVTGQLGNQGIASSSGISNLLGQLGTAQAGGATNQANSWMNALQNVGNAGQGYLQNTALLSALSNLNR